MNHYLKTIFIIFTFITQSITQSLYLDLDHWAYDFIERMELKGAFEKFDAGIKPYTRGEVANILCQIDRHLAEHPSALSNSEIGLLEQLKGEFHQELPDRTVRINPRYYERHLMTWREKKNSAWLDFDFNQKLDVKKGDQFDPAKRISETTLGGILRGHFSQSMVFTVDVRNTIQRGTDIRHENFDPSQGSPIVISGENVYSDRAIAYFVWKLPWFWLQFGRDRVKWGPSYHGGLTISKNNPLFDMIKIQTRFKRFNFIYFHGLLSSQFSRKYLVAHRLELRAASWLYLAGGETLIYGNRGLELQYLNPIMPYHVAEHHLGDKDNNMISFDLSAYPVKNLKTYFELLIDDFTLSENWLRYFGNKFGFTIGSFWVEPFGLNDVDFRVEYTRVEPYVYTHYDSVNMYINYDKIIGYWAGPNSDDWFVEANYQISKDIRFRLTWERIRKGKGDVYAFHTPAEGNRKIFLDGVVERKHLFGFQIRDQLFRDVFLSLNGYLIQTKNADRISGVNTFDQQYTFEFSLNY